MAVQLHCVITKGFSIRKNDFSPNVFKLDTVQSIVSIGNLFIQLSDDV